MNKLEMKISGKGAVRAKGEEKDLLYLFQKKI